MLAALHAGQSRENLLMHSKIYASVAKYWFSPNTARASGTRTLLARSNCAVQTENPRPPHHSKLVQRMNIVIATSVIQTPFRFCIAALHESPAPEHPRSPRRDAPCH